MDQIALRPHENYHIKSETTKNTKTWGSTRVEVWCRNPEKKIATYNRNYGNEGPFWPFKSQSGKWFALYSESYHQTFIMDLSTGKKIGECDSLRKDSPYDKSGFCPVYYYVPPIGKRTLEMGSEWAKAHNGDPLYIAYGDIEADGYQVESWWSEDRAIGFKERLENYEFAAPIGFVAGCFWGNDWAWQIKAIDLRKVEEGKVHIFNADGKCFMMPRKVNDLGLLVEVCVSDKTGELQSYSINGVDIEDMFGDGSTIDNE